MNFKRNKIIYNFIENIIVEEFKNRSYKTVITLSKLLTRFTNKHYTGNLSNHKVEYILNDISKKTIFKRPYDNKFLDNKRNILHVLTESLNTGGHTQLVINMIKNSHEEYSHDVLLTNQDLKNINIGLHDIVESKSGKLVSFNDISDDLGKSQKLYDLSENYSHILFHTHMYDPIINLAFGNGFNRRCKLFYVNHADHLFWLGCTVVDKILEIRSIGVDVSNYFRITNKSKVLNIPLTVKSYQNVSRSEARKKLNFSDDQKVFLSIGTSYKYDKFLDLDFIQTIKELCLKIPNSLFIVIGPSKKDSLKWKLAYESTNAKINAIGLINNRSELELYFKASDVYLDSFPFYSTTATLDAALFDLPIITFNKYFLANCDSIFQSNANSNSLNDYKEKAIDSLTNPCRYNIKDNVLKMHVGKSWYNEFNNILNDDNLIDIPSEKTKEDIFKQISNLFIYNLKDFNEQNPFKDFNDEYRKKLPITIKLKIMKKIFQYMNIKTKFSSIRFLFKG